MEKLCIFCEHFRWKKESMWGMGSEETGPMFEGGDATCGAGNFKNAWDSRPEDEDDFRRIILRATDCGDYKPPNVRINGQPEAVPLNEVLADRKD